MLTKLTKKEIEEYRELAESVTYNPSATTIEVGVVRRLIGAVRQLIARSRR